MSARRTAVGVLAAGLLLAASGSAPALGTSHAGGARPQRDVRSGTRTPVPAGVREARHALAQQLGIEAHVSTDPSGGGLRVLDRTDGLLSGSHAGDAADLALAYVRAHADVFGLSDPDIDALRLVRRTTSNDGVTHLTWVPVSAGVPAYDSELRVHVARDGSVVAASGPPLGGLSLPSATPQLSASQALAIAQDDVGAATSLSRAATRPGAQRSTTFANGDRARLVGFDAPGGDRLAWSVTVAGEQPYVFDEVVDAATGALLARRSLTRFASNASVFDYHPGAASGGTAHTVDLAAWLPASPTTLAGPNAHAYADVDNDDVADSAEEIPPSAGSDWSYPATFFTSVCPFCTWDESDFSTEATNRDQATTQVFYFVNAFHDWLTQPDIGFTSGSGNFQGADPVLAEADDSVLSSGPRFNNANMSTFPDGISPRMQMYLFGGSFPDVNGADDATIVYHEYTHGLSNRLIDDAHGLNENQGEAMGEGWSDWYATDYLVDHGFVPDGGADGDVVVGAYATGNSVAGIRTQPLDCAVGSVAPACAGTTTAGSGGYTLADLGHVGAYNASTPRFEVHDDGEIWSETLWDLRTAVGVAKARRLITNAMRISPAEPTFLDERDAILLADEILDSGADHDAIWQVFAARGMGFGARTASPNATRAIASSAVPALAVIEATQIDDPAPGGDGDGVPEPGELLALDVPLADLGLGALSGVQATLTSSTPGVEVPVAAASYGAIDPGTFAFGAAPFSVRLPRTMTCGTQAALTLDVTSDQGSVDLPVVVPTGSGSSAFASSDVPKAIADGAPASNSAASTLTIPSAGRIDHLRITIGATHTFVGDLHAFLTSPAGTTIALLERPGLGQDGSDLDWHGDVTLDDDASDALQEVPSAAFSGDALVGPYAPDEPLAAFAGQDRAGTWTLRFVDVVGGDAGTLVDWSIETDQPACTLLPLPDAGGPGGGSGGGVGGRSPGGGGVAAPSGLTGRATLNARHAFGLAFAATPGLRGSIRFTIPKHGRAKAISFGRRSFTVPRSGRVRLTTTVGGRALAQLRKRHRVGVTVTIVLGGRTFVRSLTLTAPRPRHRRRR